MFCLQCGKCPQTNEVWRVLGAPKEFGYNCEPVARGPLLNPKDEWNREYIYEVDGDGYVIKTLGRDGKPGGVGPDRDYILHGPDFREEKNTDPTRVPPK